MARWISKQALLGTAMCFALGGTAGSVAAQQLGDVGLTPTGEYFKVVVQSGKRVWVATDASDPVIANATRVIPIERYSPGIWVDPDGCEHWVLDDGFEGYMSPHLRRDGTPVCNR